MRSIRTLLNHPLAGAAIRYGMAGCTVAVVYLGVPLLLNGVLGLWIQFAIAIAYAMAIVLHFTLQRYFVFRHVDEFALSGRQQVGRYAGIAAVQYPTTALATAFLPRLIGVSPRVMFVAITLCISGTFFLLLRSHVFHTEAQDALIAESVAEAKEREVYEREHGNRQEPDPVSLP